MPFRLTPLILLIILLSACSREQAGDRLFVYTDAQGNLVAVQSRQESTEENNTPDQESDADPDGTARSVPRQQPGEVLDEETLKQTLEDDEDLQALLDADERDRFVVYPGGDGELVRAPVDLVAEREARAAQGPGYEDLDGLVEGGYIETMTAISADCCGHLPAHAQLLESGREVAFRFSEAERPSMAWQGSHTPVQVLRFSDELAAWRVISYKRPGGYLHPFALLLDEAGAPVLLVNNLFSRRYPETWYRYGFLQGTIAREPEHHYLVLYLPYDENNLSLGGVVAETDVPLSMTGELSVRGFARPPGAGN